MSLIYLSQVSYIVLNIIALPNFIMFSYNQQEKTGIQREKSTKQGRVPDPSNNMRLLNITLRKCEWLKIKDAYR